MALLLVTPNRDTTLFQQEVRRLDPAIDLRIWPDGGDLSDVDFAIVFKHPVGVFSQLPNLKVIASFGAGVDHIFNDPAFPEGVTVTRVIDGELPNQMRSYVVGVVVSHFRKLFYFRDRHRHKNWNQLFIKPLATAKVGLMGFGAIGQVVGEALHSLNFNVAAWTRTARMLPEWVEHHVGEAGLSEFLSELDFVVCLLPLTAETQNILNGDLFSKMKRGAYLINVARGAHVNDVDLLKAIESGQLSGACLDVFHEEPLPSTHPFWNEEKILITPHIASISDPIQVAAQIVENYHRMQKDKPLIHTVNRKLGY